MSVLTALANGAVWSVALTAAVWAILQLAPRSALNAATRYAIWWLTLAAVLALPFCKLPVPVQSGMVVQLVAIRPSDGVAPQVERLPLPAAPRRGWHPLEIASGVWLQALMAIWALGVAALLLRLALGLTVMLRTLRRAAEAPAEWQARLAYWLSAVHCGSRRVQLATSREIAIPAAAGLGRAAILIPERLFEELSGQELDHVGLHEAAHLARRDDQALVLQRAVEAMLWPHPAVRFIARQIELEREIACDDRVVEATGEAHGYAACLTRMIEMCGGVRGPIAAASMADRRSRVSRRIELLLKRRSGIPAGLLPVKILTACVALLAAAFVLSDAPRLIAFTAPLAPPAIALAQAPQPAPIVPGSKEQAPMSFRAKPIVPLAAADVAVVTAAAAEEPPQKPSGPAPEQQAEVRYKDRRMLVLYFDMTPASAVANAVKASRAVVEKADQSVIAIITFDGSALSVRQDFTSDPAKLNQVLDAIADGQDNPLFDTASVAQRLDALRKLTDMLGAIGGKKMVLHMTIPVASGGSGDDARLREVIDAAVRANVAFVPFDARNVGIIPGRR